MLTHLRKTDAFYRRPPVILTNVFFVDSSTPPISMLKYALLTLSRGYNIEKGRRGRILKTED